MPSISATSTFVDHTDNRHTALPRADRPHKGFWRTLAQYVAWLRVRRVCHMQRLCAASHQFETPAELFARQYPASYLQAFSGL